MPSREMCCRLGVREFGERRLSVDSRMMDDRGCVTGGLCCRPSLPDRQRDERPVRGVTSPPVCSVRLTSLGWTSASDETAAGCGPILFHRGYDVLFCHSGFVGLLFCQSQRFCRVGVLSQRFCRVGVLSQRFCRVAVLSVTAVAHAARSTHARTHARTPTPAPTHARIHIHTHPHTHTSSQSSNDAHQA